MSKMNKSFDLAKKVLGSEKPTKRHSSAVSTSHNKKAKKFIMTKRQK